MRFAENTSLFTIYFVLLFSYLFRLTDVFEFYFLAKKQAKFIFISKITSLTIILLLQYYGVKNEKNIINFAEVLALDFLIEGVIYSIALILKPKFLFKKYSVSLKLGRQLLKIGFPLMLSNGLIMFYIGIDEIVLK